MKQRILTWAQVETLATGAASNLLLRLDSSAGKVEPILLYGVPRGGWPAAAAVQAALVMHGRLCSLTTDPMYATAIVDDIVDSGRTLARFTKYKVPFVSLCDHRGLAPADKYWVVFPWELGDVTLREADREAASAEDIFVRLLQFVGEDAQREGLLETPLRAAKAWLEWTRGYNQKPEDVLKVFEDGASNYDEMVIVRDIPVFSKCEHHLADIFGTASIAYIPNGKIVGLSKLSRLVDVFARRLQVQERLTTQIADALETHLQPKAVGVVLRCRHMCMESRGVRQHGHSTVTSALRGALREQTAARAEFFKLIGD